MTGYTLEKKAHDESRAHEREDDTTRSTRVPLERESGSFWVAHVEAPAAGTLGENLRCRNQRDEDWSDMQEKITRSLIICT